MKETNEPQIETNEKQELIPGSFVIENFEEQKKWLVDKLSLYDVKEINEDTIGIAKANRAMLNKVAKALDDKRKEAEKAYMKPFNVGKSQYKELITLIDEESNKLGKGIKELEDKGREDKRKELEKYFNVSNTYPISFDQILDSKWLNKSTNLETAKNEIDKKLLEINSNIYNIKEQFEDKFDRALIFSFYFEDLNLENALEKYVNLRKKMKEVEKLI